MDGIEPNRRQLRSSTLTKSAISQIVSNIGLKNLTFEQQIAPIASRSNQNRTRISAMQCRCPCTCGARGNRKRRPTKNADSRPVRSGNGVQRIRNRRFYQGSRRRFGTSRPGMLERLSRDESHRQVAVPSVIIPNNGAAMIGPVVNQCDTTTDRSLVTSTHGNVSAPSKADASFSGVSIGMNAGKFLVRTVANRPVARQGSLS